MAPELEQTWRWVRRRHKRFRRHADGDGDRPHTESGIISNNPAPRSNATLGFEAGAVAGTLIGGAVIAVHVLGAPEVEVVEGVGA
jgi:hypothetical protein